ncbi:phosphoribosyl-AMP cyclohydrolase [Pseudohongiella acticola]|jgi:phosphoribosyl-AMP cyclohydrolase|uniref:Phosphoribosyl-AMP cyclohydrolase n=1 Tax=Pseudohongiella acticola TaxID=1524254 RepID=A0A1E8CK80_9GAMM|nr:phosphoribosyl-AMP cyclohydrolase [Pseudohongiella acticola]OFE12871.1 phosphoribosyl-AMP cyclohydrolase [Pseudohongiella acticola]
MIHTAWLDQIKWNDDGLVPVVTQDRQSRRLLTHAWINREALALTLAEGRAVYWSRSRQKIWRKGEESGNVQRIHDILLDCDGDTVCYLVEQIGGIACHTGRESCFYRTLTTVDGEPGWQISDPVLKEPSAMYTKPGH